MECNRTCKPFNRYAHACANECANANRHTVHTNTENTYARTYTHKDIYTTKTKTKTQTQMKMNTQIQMKAQMKMKTLMQTKTHTSSSTPTNTHARTHVCEHTRWEHANAQAHSRRRDGLRRCAVSMRSRARDGARTYRRMLAHAYAYTYTYAYASSCVLASAYSHRGSDVHGRPWIPSACTRRACPTLTRSRPCAYTGASSCRCGSLVQARARARQRRGRSAHRAFHTPRTPRKYLTQGAVCWS
jgi:hypothetical protein